MIAPAALQQKHLHRAGRALGAAAMSSHATKPITIKPTAMRGTVVAVREV